MKKKIYNLLQSVNTYLLILAAIFTGTGSILGSFLFCYTSTIGLIEGIRTKVTNAIIVNSTFLALNTFFVIKSFL